MEVRVLREKRRCAGELSIPSDGVFLNSSSDNCGSRPASKAFFRICFAVLTLFSALPLDWGYRGEVFKLFCKLLELSAVKLWSIVCGNSVWKPVSSQMGLTFINNSFRSLRRQHIHFEEVGITVSGNQVVKAVELKQVSRDALPRSRRNFIAH